MPPNDLAIQKLRRLRRGETLGYSGTWRTRRCTACSIAYRKPRLTCPTCAHNDGPWPPRPCRLCEEPVPKGRVSWCGEQCVHLYSLVTSSAYLRAKVHERDRGVCAECGLDCDAIEERLRRMTWEQKRRAAAEVSRMGFDWDPGYGGRVSLWDADHIQALDEGGAGWDLDNVQTLCQPCHKDKTAEQAGRRGKQRRLLSRKELRARRMNRDLGLVGLAGG